MKLKTSANQTTQLSKDVAYKMGEHIYPTRLKGD